MNIAFAFFFFHNIDLMFPKIVLQYIPKDVKKLRQSETKIIS